MDTVHVGEENPPWTNQAFMLAGQPRVRIWKAWTSGQMQGLETKADKSFTRMQKGNGRRKSKGSHEAMAPSRERRKESSGLHGKSQARKGSHRGSEECQENQEEGRSQQVPSASSKGKTKTGLLFLVTSDFKEVNLSREMVLNGSQLGVIL